MALFGTAGQNGQNKGSRSGPKVRWALTGAVLSGQRHSACHGMTRTRSVSCSGLIEQRRHLLNLVRVPARPASFRGARVGVVGVRGSTASDLDRWRRRRDAQTGRPVGSSTPAQRALNPAAFSIGDMCPAPLTNLSVGAAGQPLPSFRKPSRNPTAICSCGMPGNALIGTTRMSCHLADAPGGSVNSRRCEFLAAARFFAARSHRQAGTFLGLCSGHELHTPLHAGRRCSRLASNRLR